MIAAQLSAMMGTPNRPPRGTPVLGGSSSFTLGATIQSTTRYFSGAYDDPSDTVRYSITSSNPSVISFTNGTDVTSSQPVTVNVLQNVTSPISVSCTITTKDKFGAAGVSNNISITVGTFVNRLLTYYASGTFTFPSSIISQAIIYVQAQGGGGGGGGYGRDYPGQPAYAGSSGMCGSPGALMVAAFSGNPPKTAMTLTIGNASTIGGTGGIVDTGTAGSTGYNSSISSSFLNVTANGGQGGNGGYGNSYQPGTADGPFGSIPSAQSTAASGNGAGTGWDVQGPYSGYINGAANYPSKGGNYAAGGAVKPSSDSISIYQNLFGDVHGAGGNGGSGGDGWLNSPLSYKRGNSGDPGIGGVIRIEYMELI